jgi:hypothetical protein
MQVVKGDQNGYPVPWGIAGPLCPGGYKYGGLVLQVGGRAGGRQPVAVKKKTVRKVNCGLGTFSPSGIELRWKKIYELWNCVQIAINACKCKIIHWKEK